MGSAIAVNGYLIPNVYKYWIPLGKDCTRTQENLPKRWVPCTLSTQTISLDLIKVGALCTCFTLVFSIQTGSSYRMQIKKLKTFFSRGASVSLLLAYIAQICSQLSVDLHATKIHEVDPGVGNRSPGSARWR